MTTSPKEQLDKLASKYIGAAYVVPLEYWTTEDLTRLAGLIDVELQERAFRAEFKSPFDVDECR